MGREDTSAFSLSTSLQGRVPSGPRKNSQLLVKSHTQRVTFLSLPWTSATSFLWLLRHSRFYDLSEGPWPALVRVGQVARPWLLYETGQCENLTAGVQGLHLGFRSSDVTGKKHKAAKFASLVVCCYSTFSDVTLILSPGRIKKKG